MRKLLTLLSMVVATLVLAAPAVATVPTPWKGAAKASKAGKVFPMPIRDYRPVDAR